MGNSAAAAAAAAMAEEEVPAHASFLDLPTECIVLIVSFLHPRDACTLALVCSALKDFVHSDDVWEPRLPIGCPRTLLPPLASKKDLYSRLWTGALLNAGTEVYWLDHGTGEGCFMKSARSLYIIWGDDQRYWNWVSLNGSWFHEAAYLKKVCWFEVGGEFESNFKPGAYTVSFRIRKDNPRGWERAPVKFTLSTSNGHHVESHRFFQGEQTSISERSLDLTPLRSSAMWDEYDVGEFFVEESETLVKVKFLMVEIDGGNWKQGILLDGVKVQPSLILK